MFLLMIATVLLSVLYALAWRNEPARKPVTVRRTNGNKSLMDDITQFLMSHRAPLLGYEARMELREQGNRILQVRDPNGNWLQVQASENAAIAGPGSLWGGCPQEASALLIYKESEATTD